MLWDAFPDVEATIEELVGEGDAVPSGSQYEARIGASSWGSPRAATKSPSASKHVPIPRGKVIERSTNPDLLGLMMQIGAIPPPG